ncbi:hypothetical protein GGI20_001247 [Coemansia sp. BCRC 34301]|nr:hypothetical protein GGI20_001247 [Coemansia sp. BCRC 34301]
MRGWTVVIGGDFNLALGGFDRLDHQNNEPNLELFEGLCTGLQLVVVVQHVQLFDPTMTSHFTYSKKHQYVSRIDLFLIPAYLATAGQVTYTQERVKGDSFWYDHDELSLQLN